MALKIELKPGERVILGDCVVTNDDQRTRLLIEGKVPILREKDIMTQQPRQQPGQAHLSRRAADVHVEAPARPPRALLSAGARDHAGRAEYAALY